MNPFFLLAFLIIGVAIIFCLGWGLTLYSKDIKQRRELDPSMAPCGFEPATGEPTHSCDKCGEYFQRNRQKRQHCSLCGFELTELVTPSDVVMAEFNKQEKTFEEIKADPQTFIDKANKDFLDIYGPRLSCPKCKKGHREIGFFKEPGLLACKICKVLLEEANEKYVKENKTFIKNSDGQIWSCCSCAMIHRFDDYLEGGLCPRCGASIIFKPTKGKGRNPNLLDVAMFPSRMGEVKSRCPTCLEYLTVSGDACPHCHDALIPVQLISHCPKCLKPGIDTMPTPSGKCGSCGVKLKSGSPDIVDRHSSGIVNHPLNHYEGKLQSIDYFNNPEKIKNIKTLCLNCKIYMSYEGSECPNCQGEVLDCTITMHCPSCFNPGCYPPGTMANCAVCSTQMVAGLPEPHKKFNCPNCERVSLVLPGKKKTVCPECKTTVKTS